MPELSDLNLNKQLYRESVSSDGDYYTPESLSGVVSGSSSSPSSSSSETVPESITSGELLGNLIMVDGFIRSKNYIANTSGWTINADGSVEFDSGYFRGDITGSTGSFSGSITIGSGNNIFKADTNGIYLGNATFASAPFSVTMAGALKATSATITGGVIDGTSTVGGRTASILASAIDASGHFADAAISTATQSILGSFTFGASGALQIGTYVNGVSGDLKISPNGILARSSTGTTTFSIDGTTGIAVLNGLVVGTNVGLGTAQDSAGVTTIIGNTVTTSFVNALNVNAATVSASISISSPSITGGSIAIGSSNNIFKADSNGIYLGNATFANAPFRVDMSGALTSTSATITGEINATSGKFGTSTNYWSVGSTGLTAVSASNDVFINYGKTDFGQDTTNGFILGYDYSASKSKLEIGSSATKILKYDGTDFTLIGGTITGGTVQTSSSSNTGVKMTSSGFAAYGEVMAFYNTSGNLRGYIGASSSELYMIGVTNQSVKIGSYQDIYLDAGAGWSVTPARANVDLGNSNYFWRNVHANKYTFSDTSYYLSRSDYALVFNGMNRLTMDGGTFRRVGFTFKDGSGTNRYIEVLATDDPV